MNKLKNPIKWGIIGLGKIAHKFVEDLQLLEGTVVVSVASRVLEKSKLFAQQYNISKFYGDYISLMQDKEVDIIYIATPHHVHCDLAIQAMKYGKAVLCEKPLAVNEQQVSKMIEAAQENKVFLMEALWTRFNPVLKEVKSLVEKGVIGDICNIQADFHFNASSFPLDGRVFNTNLAGGSLLDVGIYPVFLTYILMGKPKEILSNSIFHTTGSDLQTSMIFKYEKTIANLSGGFDSDSEMTAKINGSKAAIHIHPRWHEAHEFSILTKSNRTTNVEVFELPKLGKGYTHEILECNQCIREGALESKLWSHQNSLELIQILDEIRRQIGLKYPFEK